MFHYDLPLDKLVLSTLLIDTDMISDKNQFLKYQSTSYRCHGFSKKFVNVQFLKLFFRVLHNTSLFDNAPNYLFGCVIQKKIINALKILIIFFFRKEIQLCKVFWQQKKIKFQIMTTNKNWRMKLWKICTVLVTGQKDYLKMLV